MKLSYERYYDAVLGGWLGKCMGGAVGARFEGHKAWIEIEPNAMFPATMPANDDLDLQVLWLRVLEEKGAHLTADDLSAAWLNGCWYPFNEYGIFRRNWRLGLHAPTTGQFGNQFWNSGMGCPIRAEIWGYVFPGAPDLAAHYAGLDGSLDHGEESIGAEKMFASMASMAFFIPDVRRLSAMFLHYLPLNSRIEKLTKLAFDCYDSGVSLRVARERIMAVGGVTEACDARTNVPFTFLGLLYGGNDLQQVMLNALRCGYDTDCTMATGAALIGQILGARAIPQELKTPIGDDLVMGIEYSRPEMTISALARDTSRVGVLLCDAAATGVTIENAPAMAPFPATAQAPQTTLRIEYDGLPCAAPGETVSVQVHLSGATDGTLHIETPRGWSATPSEICVDDFSGAAKFALRADANAELWSQKNLFTVRHVARGDARQTTEHVFGVAGAGLWKFLGVYFDGLPEADNARHMARKFYQHFVSHDREYLPEPNADVDAEFRKWSQILGRPAVLPSYQHEIDVSQMVGIEGPYCTYLVREIVSPQAREAFAVIGNTDSYKLFLNGELVADVDDLAAWTPFNNAHKIALREGENHLFLKLIKRTDAQRFTFGLRNAEAIAHGDRNEQNHQDWLVDLADAVPRVA